MVTGAVGPTLLDVSIEGVLVAAVADTGAQSTISSRTMLHRIHKHMKSEAKSLPSWNCPLPHSMAKVEVH